MTQHKNIETILTGLPLCEADKAYRGGATQFRDIARQDKLQSQSGANHASYL